MNIYLWFLNVFVIYWICNLIIKLQEELRNMEEEQNRSIRGFREVIDLISTSQKPVVAHNSLNGLSLVNILDIFGAMISK